MYAAPQAPEVPTIVLDSTDQAPRLARRFLAEQFAGWGVTDDYTGRLVVCELTTNAYRHGEGPIVVRLYLDPDDGQPVIEVSDTGTGHPTVQPQNDAATSGRGLQLMAELVHEWGVKRLAGGSKVVWAKLP
ncbi:ATP-binding protein [Actinomadura sp. 7K534]|uniref:ATP-binding protein n=1 Tax=Actinomadura sp. 7K534 TaxID=2530366 RepID=UPI0010452C89|nr:ATP-binding protein [Actinomadura sp. 7K534]TDB85552.1 ATP-binding protein [Actinomadura sp. 7K534]